MLLWSGQPELWLAAANQDGKATCDRPSRPGGSRRDPGKSSGRRGGLDETGLVGELGAVACVQFHHGAVDPRCRRCRSFGG